MSASSGTSKPSAEAETHAAEPGAKFPDKEGEAMVATADLFRLATQFFRCKREAEGYRSASQELEQELVRLREGTPPPPALRLWNVIVKWRRIGAIEVAPEIRTAG